MNKHTPPIIPILHIRQPLSGFTPAPWVVYPANTRFVCAESNCEQIIAEAWFTTIEATEAKANAELIALAPTLLAQRNALLEALQEINALSWWSETSCPSPANLEYRLNQILIQTRAAIAFAQGGGK